MTRNYQAETAASITALARRIMVTNLCQEIVGVQPMTGPVGGIFTMRASYTPQPKYKFSRKHWYIAHYGLHDVIEVFDWCEQQFGQCPENRDAWTRWHSDSPWTTIWFRDEKDYMWFQLRWA